MTDRSPFTRVRGGVAAVVGYVALVLAAGLSLLARLFLLIPLVFVGLLLRIAVRYYFGSPEPAPDAPR